jgi:CheY-like chemotaxis protein
LPHIKLLESNAPCISVPDVAEKNLGTDDREPPVSTPAMKPPPPPPVRTILLVDDGHDTRILTKWFLNNFGFVVDSTQNASEALARFDPRVHDLVITDNAMPGMSGAELAHVLKLRSPTTPIIMFSGNPPTDPACLDLVLQRPAHLMLLKEGVDQLLAAPVVAASK